MPEKLNDYQKLLNSIHFGGVSKKFSEHSTIPIEKQKEMRQKHKRDLIQPRREGQLNPEFVKEYGYKNINLSETDVKQLEKKSLGQRFDKMLHKEAKNQGL